MDEETLKSFIKTRGQQSKDAFKEICIFQTEDSIRTKKLSQDLEAQHQLQYDNKKAFSEKFEGYDKEKASEEGNIATYKEKIEKNQE